MKHKLPENHGLSDSALKNLLFEENGEPALSDVQYAAVEFRRNLTHLAQ
jgi:hypothetical protein